MISRTLIAVLCICSIALALDPTDLGDYWGTVLISGELAQQGITVKGYVDGVLKDTTTTNDEGYYLLHLEGTNESTVTFKVAGVSSSVELSWAKANNPRQNLSITKFSNGASCTINQLCSSAHCVHSVCRATTQYCGDGFIDGTETCDGSNVETGYTCSSDCLQKTKIRTGGGGGSYVPPTTVETPGVIKETPEPKQLGKLEDTLQGVRELLSEVGSSENAVQTIQTVIQKQKEVNVQAKEQSQEAIQVVQANELNDLMLSQEIIEAGEQELTQAKGLIQQAENEQNQEKKQELLQQALDIQERAMAKIPEVNVLPAKKEVQVQSQVTETIRNEASKTEKGTQEIEGVSSRITNKVQVTKRLQTVKISNKEVTENVVEKTRISLQLTAQEKQTNVEVIEVIPESIAKNVEDIVFSVEPEVIQEDPIVKWVIPEMEAGETFEVYYTLQTSAEDIESETLVAADQETQVIQTPVIPNVPEEQSTDFTGLVFLFILVVIIIGVVYYKKTPKRRKKK